MRVTEKVASIAVASTAIFFGLTFACAATHTPCDGIDRMLTRGQTLQLSKRAAEQFADPGATVDQIFRLGGWSILYVNFTKSDPGFVFYNRDPMNTHYITVWGGAAGYNEEDEMRLWTLQNVHGIPPKLAACFAWHVTKDRDM